MRRHDAVGWARRRLVLVISIFRITCERICWSFDLIAEEKLRLGYSLMGDEL